MDDTTSKSSLLQASTGAPEANESRRRLLRGGLAAAPVMMTLVSRPVHAGQPNNGVCTAASSVGSINTSGLGDRMYSCGGKTPNTWSSGNSWPANCAPTGKNCTMFDTVFGGSTYPGKSMLDILKMSSTSGQNGLARYLAAAYLNSSAYLVPDKVLSVVTGKAIWSSVVLQKRGWYEPTAGVKWYADYSEPTANQPAGIIAWVKTTMIS